MLLTHRLLRGCDRCRPGTAVQVERPQRGEDDLGGGEYAGDHLDLAAGGWEVGGVAITEGDRSSRGRCAVIPRRSPILRALATAPGTWLPSTDQPSRGKLSWGVDRTDGLVLQASCGSCRRLRDAGRGSPSSSDRGSPYGHTRLTCLCRGIDVRGELLVHGKGGRARIMEDRWDERVLALTRFLRVRRAVPKARRQRVRALASATMQRGQPAATRPASFRAPRRRPSRRRPARRWQRSAGRNAPGGCSAATAAPKARATSPGPWPAARRGPPAGSPRASAAPPRA